MELNKSHSSSLLKRNVRKFVRNKLAMLGLIVVMLLAASMSTLASLVLASASCISIDLMKGALRKDMTDQQTTFWMRVLCGVFMAISVVIALAKVDVIVNLMSFSWGAASRNREFTCGHIQWVSRTVASPANFTSSSSVS